LFGPARRLYNAKRGISLPTSEIQLARDLLSGKPEAFERFVEVFRTRIFQYTLMMCGHHEDAEEVAQDTLLKVFENIDQLREPERVRAWVFRIARNACYMKRRKSVFAPAQELSLEEFLPPVEQSGERRKLEIADWSALPEEEFLRGELRSVIREAISELPEIYRSVILLRDMEELTTEETAQVLDVSNEVVKTRLHRARLAIRQKLDDYLRHVQDGKAAGKLRN
jgi:RNA polymerase sigma-70 factor (ECF subfamily)